MRDRETVMDPLDSIVGGRDSCTNVNSRSLSVPFDQATPTTYFLWFSIDLRVCLEKLESSPSVPKFHYTIVFGHVDYGADTVADLKRL